MDASILLVGSQIFLNLWSEPIERGTYTLEVALDPREAVPLIQAQQPDILIIDASQPDNLALCRQIKAQSRLAWIYCILLDQRDQEAIEPWTVLQQQELENKAIALEAGADAYLWLPVTVSDQKEDRFTDLGGLYPRLLNAQIQAGLRRLQNHRELMRTNDLLSAIALTDPLTELNNRRALEWELPRQIQSARLRNAPISVIMLDVDYFKTINDTYGHLVGDRALQLLSARLRHNLRFYDTPFRYGGEEFVVILRDTSCQETALIAHRICKLISEQPFVITNSLDLTITISAGAASLTPKDDAKGTSLLYRADQNLLKAKLQGRNRVVTCKDTMDCPDETCPAR